MTAARAPRCAPEVCILAVAAALAVLAAAGCTGEPACTVPDGVAPAWIAELGCEADEALLWDERDDAIFARTRIINWIIDREDEDALYFIDTDRFDLHYQFAAAFLDHGPPFTPVGSHAEFNLLNYRRPGRRFLLGKLVRYLDQDLLTLELSAGDAAGADLIVLGFDRVRRAIHHGDRLVYRPVSASQEALLGELAGRVPVIRTEEVFRGQTYQPLNQVTGVGTLRFRRLSELGGRALSPTDIAVLDRVPNDISLVSGLVTAEFQTPLAHVNLLSKNRGTPNMALRGAWDDPSLRALEDRLVRLEVGPQDFSIREATREEAEAYWDQLRPPGPLVPELDLTWTEPVDLDAADAGDASRIGAKAANLAELARVRVAGAPLSTPADPFAIPLSAYRRHIEASGIDLAIEALLEDAPGLSGEDLAARLFDLRWTIYQAPMDPDLRARVAAEARARWGDAARVRFRSSTNVEDLPDFSGAGLYTSASADLARGEQAVEDAVKVVWASAWNLQAFVERDFYRVDQRQVGMGVLVHPAMPDELANGVAVTINEFAENRPAFFINAQLGEVSVTNPTGLAVPEQLLFYTWYEEPEVEVITRSSLVARVPGWPAFPAVLADTELEELGAALTAIHAHFAAMGGGGADFAMDVEWKLDPDHRVVIKQARPLVRRSSQVAP